MFKKPWLLYALVTTLFWGTWGALIEKPEQAGFPATLGYIVWSITMIPCALVGLALIKWKLDHDVRSIIYGLTIGLLGAGGQLALFHALVAQWLHAGCTFQRGLTLRGTDELRKADQAQELQTLCAQTLRDCTKE